MSHQVEKATLKYVHGCKRVQPVFLPGGKGYMLRETSKAYLLFRRPNLLSAVSDVNEFNTRVSTLAVNFEVP